MQVDLPVYVCTVMDSTLIIIFVAAYATMYNLNKSTKNLSKVCTPDAFLDYKSPKVFSHISPFVPKIYRTLLLCHNIYGHTPLK